MLGRGGGDGRAFLTPFSASAVVGLVPAPLLPACFWLLFCGRGQKSPCGGGPRGGPSTAEGGGIRRVRAWQVEERGGDVKRPRRWRCPAHFLSLGKGRQGGGCGRMWPSSEQLESLQHRDTWNFCFKSKQPAGIKRSLWGHGVKGTLRPDLSLPGLQSQTPMSPSCPQLLFLLPAKAKTRITFPNLQLVSG